MKKILFLLGLLALLIGLPLALNYLSQTTIFSLTAQNSSQPENIIVSTLGQNAARVSWTTTQATQGLVNYGLDKENLSLVQAESESATSHQINLTRLLSNRTYFFTIKIDEKTFRDKNNQPFEFTTTGQNTTSFTNPAEATDSQATQNTGPALTEAGFLTTMGTNNATYDLNQDGVVNWLDLQLFRQPSPEVF